MDVQMIATLNIAAAGLGYVGLANTVLLAQGHRVIAADVAQERVDMVAKANPHRRRGAAGDVVATGLASHAGL